MPQTGVLGSRESQLGQLLLGVASDTPSSVLATQELQLTQSVDVSVIRSIAVEQSLELVESAQLNGQRHISSQLDLSQSVTVQRDIVIHVSDTLALAGVAGKSLPGPSTMSLTNKLGSINSRLGSIILGVAPESEGGGGGTLEQNTQNAIVFVQTVSVVREISVSVVDTLTLVDTLDNFTTAEIEDNLGLTDSATAEVIRRLGHSLGLTDSVDVRGPIYISVQHNLNLTQPADGGLGIINQDIENEIAFQDSVGRIIEISVEQSIAFTDSGDRLTLGVADSLGLVQTATVGKGLNVEQDLGLSDSATVNGVFGRALTSSLGLTHSATYVIVGSCTERQYTPFVGFSSDTSYTPPSTTAPTLGRATLTLTYPPTSPTHTVVLRNPRFGNRERLLFNRINRETRGGTLIVFADPSWPKVQTLQFDVQGLKASQVADLLTFFAVSLGKEIGLLDHENRQWQGIILNPDADVSQPGRADRSFILEFEGMLV